MIHSKRDTCRNKQCQKIIDALDAAVKARKQNNKIVIEKLKRKKSSL